MYDTTKLPPSYKPSVMGKLPVLSKTCFQRLFENKIIMMCIFMQVTFTLLNVQTTVTMKVQKENE